MPSLRFGRFGIPAVLSVASAGLAAMVFMLGTRVNALQQQGQRTREAIVRTAPGDWLLVDSLPALGGGWITVVGDSSMWLEPPSDANKPTGALTLFFAFAPECPVCRSRAPLWRRIADEASVAAPDVRLLALAALADTTMALTDSASAFLLRHNLTSIPTAVVNTRRTQRALALRSVPQTFIADAAGRVWWAARDSVHTAWLADSLLPLVARIHGQREVP